MYLNETWAIHPQNMKNIIPNMYPSIARLYGSVITPTPIIELSKLSTDDAILDFAATCCSLFLVDVVSISYLFSSLETSCWDIMK
jgi:hypothetical protein